MRPIPSAISLIFLSAGLIFGQADSPSVSETGAGLPGTIPLEVPAGTPLPVVLDKEVRIRKAGQPIHGKIAEPVYAFDTLVIPAGSEVTGSVRSIGGVSATARTLAALDANLSPARNVDVNFDELVLPDGRHIPLHTHVSVASQGVLQFATAADAKSPKDPNEKHSAKKLASDKVNGTKQEIAREWETAKQQVTA